MEKLIEMTEEKIRIMQELKLSLEDKLNENLRDVILFGSQLTEKRSVESDYDILVVVKNKADWKLEREISDVCYDIDLKFGILTDTHVLSESDLTTPRGKQPIFVNAINKGYRA